MRFLYKIHSGYDGFRPSVLGQRMSDGCLRLGWKRYLDAVHEQDEVWIYFHGPHRFRPGVYAKGRVVSLDLDAASVDVRLFDFDEARPVVDASTSARVASMVSTRGRQVFVYPDEWETGRGCNVFGAATSCAARECGTCGVHAGLAAITPSTVQTPPRLRRTPLAGFFPAYWVRPARCYIAADRLKPEVIRTSSAFTSFKIGNAHLAFPLALGMREAIRAGGGADATVVVPIPLSPDKVQAGEFHRTRALANELGQLLGQPVLDALALDRPISKRRLQARGVTTAQFEMRYSAALQVAPTIGRHRRVLLVDDVSTHGSTLYCAATALSQLGHEVSVATAAQMITTGALRRESAVTR